MDAEIGIFRVLKVWRRGRTGWFHYEEIVQDVADKGNGTFVE